MKTTNIYIYTYDIHKLSIFRVCKFYYIQNQFMILGMFIRRMCKVMLGAQVRIENTKQHKHMMPTSTSMAVITTSTATMNFLPNSAKIYLFICVHCSIVCKRKNEIIKKFITFLCLNVIVRLVLSWAACVIRLFVTGKSHQRILLCGSAQKGRMASIANGLMDWNENETWNININRNW